MIWAIGHNLFDICVFTVRDIYVPEEYEWLHIKITKSKFSFVAH